MEIGDKVRFLNDTGGGIITDFIDKELVKVLTDDGFEFPVLKKEVIVVSTEPIDFDNYQKKDKEENEGISNKNKQLSEQVVEKNQITLADFLKQKKPKTEKKKEEGRKTKIKSSVEEVDLHIQNILPDHKDLSSGEILEAQMDRFTTSLISAIIHGQKKIVFIHGRGAGKLKYEIRKKLETDYPRLKFQDASFKEYGYGATMVIIS